MFSIMSDATPYTTPEEISINEDFFINETKNDGKNINSKIFNDYFAY